MESDRFRKALVWNYILVLLQVLISHCGNIQNFIDGDNYSR